MATQSAHGRPPGDITPVVSGTGRRRRPSGEPPPLPWRVERRTQLSLLLLAAVVALAVLLSSRRGPSCRHRCRRHPAARAGEAAHRCRDRDRGPRRPAGVHRRGPRGRLADAGGAAGLPPVAAPRGLPRGDAGHHPRRRRRCARHGPSPPDRRGHPRRLAGLRVPVPAGGRDLPGARRRAVRPGAAGRRAHPGRAGCRRRGSLRLASPGCTWPLPTIPATCSPRVVLGTGSAAGGVPPAHARRRLPGHATGAAGGAHLELSPSRYDAIVRALDQQLGLAVESAELFGTRGLCRVDADAAARADHRRRRAAAVRQAVRRHPPAVRPLVQADAHRALRPARGREAVLDRAPAGGVRGPHAPPAARRRGPGTGAARLRRDHAGARVPRADGVPRGLAGARRRPRRRGRDRQRPARRAPAVGGARPTEPGASAAMASIASRRSKRGASRPAGRRSRPSSARRIAMHAGW